MAYLVPTQAVTGQLVTAAEWNKNTVDNVIALSTALLIPEHRSGNYYGQQGASIDPAGGGVNIVQNILYAAPITIPSTATYDRIAVYAFTETRTIRLGIYSDSNGLPDALILDAGTKVISGVPAIQTITISQSLPGPAKYWLAIVVSTGAQHLVAYDGVSIGVSPLSGDITRALPGVFRVFSFAALPNPFGGTPAGGDVPLIGLRKA